MGSPVLLDLRRVLLEGLIDYAGLFPPASLDMEAAVAEYRTARNRSHSWMLGRFICTASRLEELAGVLTASMPTGEDPWPISAVLDGEVATAAAASQSFGAHMGNAAEVVLAEVRLPAEATDRARGAGIVRDIAVAATSVSPTVTAVLEVPRDESWSTSIPAMVAAIADEAASLARPIGAKLRCGGLDADAFPSSAQIARFLISCRTSGVPYKATAGLHHPVRHHDPGLGVMMHGFLNVLMASALVEEGADESMVIDALEETEPGAFTVTRAALAWRSARAGVATIRTVRDARFPSYGSCSFDEPVSDLVALGILDP